MLQKVSEFIKKNNMLSDGQTIGVAVSGGIDSMVLLDVLRKLGFRIKVLHYEHGIRGDESKNDALFVKRFCDENNIDAEIVSGDVLSYAKENKYSIET